MRITDDYVFFWKGFMSQWAKSDFVEGTVKFNCAEQYMMYKKAMLFEDTDIAQQILNVSHPAEQKALGRKVKNYDNDVWEDNRYNIVFTGNILKFTQNPDLERQLLDTKYDNKELVEASPYDKIWGIAMFEDDDGVEDKRNWKGLNLLGEVITHVRKVLIEAKLDLE